MNTEQQITAMIDPLAVDAGQLGYLLGVSKSTIERMNVSGKLPKPVHFGKCCRWPVETIREWLQMGAPDRTQFEISRKEL